MTQHELIIGIALIISIIGAICSLLTIRSQERDNKKLRNLVSRAFQDLGYFHQLLMENHIEFDPEKMQTDGWISSRLCKKCGKSKQAFEWGICFECLNKIFACTKLGSADK